MSRHQRRSSSSSTRSRIVVGSAMTAVFLSGGAGVALAEENEAPKSSESGNVIETVTGTVDNTVGEVTDTLDGLLGGKKTTIEQTGKNNTATVINGDGNTVTNNTTNNYGTKHDEKKNDNKGDKKHRDCGCPKDAKKDDDHKKDCPKERESVKHESKKKDDDKDDAVMGVTTVANVDDDEVKGDSVDDEEVQGVSVEDVTPVGSADTGDGSFVPGVAPVASTWSTGDSMLAAGGALAAAGLLAGAGVGVGRHRRGGTHRVSA